MHEGPGWPDAFLRHQCPGFKIVNYYRLTYYLLLVGMALLPSRSAPIGAETEFVLAIPLIGEIGVVHYGMPFLVGSGLATLLYRSFHPLPFQRNLAVPLGIAIVYLLCIFGFSFVSQDVGGSLLRAIINLVGFGIFFTLLNSASDFRALARNLPVRALSLLVWSGVILAGYYLGNLALQGKALEQHELFEHREVGGAMGLPLGRQQ